MSEKKICGSSFKGRVVVRGKEVEVWKKIKKQIQPQDTAKVCDTASVATQPHALRDTEEGKDREGLV